MTHDAVRRPKKSAASEVTLDAQAARLQLLETMLDQFPDYVFAKDRDGRMIYGNRVTIEDSGFESDEDVIGKTDLELFPGHASTMLHALEQDLMARGLSSLDNEEPAISCKGVSRWLTVSRAPLRSPDGEVVGLVGIARDITTRKRAKCSFSPRRACWSWSPRARRWTISLPRSSSSSRNITRWSFPRCSSWRRMGSI